MSKTKSEQSVELIANDRVIEPARHMLIQTPDVSGNTGHPKILLHFPGQFTAFLYKNRGRMLKIGLMTLVFISAIYTKSYTGEFQMLINNHIGGIFYVVFGSLVFSLLFPGMKIVLPVMMATGATCILEFVQWFQFPFMKDLTRIKVFAWLFGNSFNPEDFIFYGLGSVLALLILWLIREN